MKRLLILMAAVVAASALAKTGHSRFFTRVRSCPVTPSASQCTSDRWVESSCGQQSLESGSCTSVCGGLTISDSQCGDPEFLSSICGQAELAAWEQAIAQKDVSLSQCAAHRVGFSRTGRMYWRKRPSPDPVPVLEPSEVCSDGACWTQAGDLGAEATKIDSTNNLDYAGAFTSMRGFRRRMLAASGWASFAYKAKLQAWDDNGSNVGSCEEYVYEKYYDYTLFEDKTLGSRDFRTYMDVGYASKLSFFGATAMPGAIGRMGMLDDPLAAKDGTPIEPQPSIARTRLKNIFYSSPPQSASPGTPTVWPAASLPYLEAPAKEGCGGSIEEIIVCDPAISAARFAGRNVEVEETWAFHHQMSKRMAAAGYMDEELYRADMLKDEFALHLNERARAFRALLEHLHVFDDWSPAVTLRWPNDWQNDWAPGDPLPFEDPIGQVLDLSRARSGAYGGASPLVPALQLDHLAGLSELAGQIYDVRGVDPSQAEAIAAQGALRRYQAAQLSYARSSDSMSYASAPEIDPWTSPNALDAAGGPGRLIELMAAVVEADYVLEQDLTAARALGCLPDNPRQITPCDWSPRDFAQSVTDLYETERQADYARCQDSTAALGFDEIAGRNLGVTIDGTMEYPVIWGQATLGTISTPYFCALDGAGEIFLNKPQNSVSCPSCNRWNQSTSHLDQYFSCLSEYKALLLQTVSELGPLQDETGKLQLASSRGDYEEMGDSQWNMYYGYGMGWSVGEFDNWVAGGDYSNTCALAPEVYGHFKVGATGLGHSVDIIKASAHIRTGGSSTAPAEVKTDRLYIEIAGMKNAMVDKSTKVDAGFNIVRGNKGTFESFVSVKVPFALGPIPMSIAGGVAGGLGVNYSVDAALSCDHKGISGTFSPYASINGFATLAIDALIAEAGVKISLTIIRAELPFTVSAALTGTGNQAMFTVDSNLDLVLSTLGGYFAVYLRILTETWEWQLFSWDGLRFVENLFSHRFSVPIADVARVVSEI